MVLIKGGERIEIPGKLMGHFDMTTTIVKTDIYPMEKNKYHRERYKKAIEKKLKMELHQAQMV